MAASVFNLQLRGVGVKAARRDGAGSGARWRLRDVTVDVQAGQRIGVIGANGAGKTTLLRVMSGLERPSRGRLVRRLGAGHGGRVMLVMQRPEEHFVAQTVRLELAGYSRDRLDEKAIAALFDAVGLNAGLADRSPRALSSGEQRALGLACGLATAPALLLLDEPLAHLDAPNRAVVTQALQRISETRDLAICMVSHHADDLLGWAEQVWALVDGALAYAGAFDQVPAPIVNACLDPGRPSLFAALRRIEAAGYPLDPRLYTRLPADEAARLLDAAFGVTSPVVVADGGAGAEVAPMASGGISL